MIAYLHGFNSAFNATNPKIYELEKIDEVLPFSYNSFGRREEILENIVSLLGGRVRGLVGTSLGGYYAAEVGKILQIPTVMINPCLDPYLLLRKEIGQPRHNYVNAEFNVLEEDILESYRGYPISPDRFADISANPLVLLDLEDELLDSRHTAEILKDWSPVLFGGGSHRFDHMKEAMEHICVKLGEKK
jgi:predicted esterase YcpF (UPF0227 family)